LMLRGIGAHQLMTHSFIKLGEEFVDARIWRDGLIGDLEKKDAPTEAEKETIASVKKAYESRVKELRQRRDDILDGKYNGEYKPQTYSQKVLYYGECLEPYNDALKQGFTNG
jgi:hypothetical protein